MALDSVDTSGMKLEEEAEKLRAQELVKQFKMEMGMDSKVEKPIQDSGSPLDNRDKTI
jgi:phage shock protein A